MKIALDYDGTFTEAPGLWREFIKSFQKGGHQVMIVTFRGEDTPIDGQGWFRYNNVRIFYTNRKPKRQFMLDQGIFINVWIDDQPDLIISESQWSDEEYNAWKEKERNAKTVSDWQSQKFSNLRANELTRIDVA